MNKLLIVILVLALAACGNSKKNKAGSTNAEDITLTGAGATFPLPYYNLAFKTYKDSTRRSSYLWGYRKWRRNTEFERPNCRFCPEDDCLPF